MSPGDARAGEYPDHRLCVICDVTNTALVLGSAQPFADADTDACRVRGVEVTRRACGGGAVIVRPRAQLWLDAFLPAGDPLFERDVGKSFRWLGEVWAGALTTAGALLARRVEVARPGQRPSPWARRLCYGSLGAGEVTVDGLKVVGIAQRRTRAGAWFHSMAQLEDSSGLLVECLALEGDEAAAARRQLEVTSAPVRVTLAALRRELAARLV